MAVVLQDNFTRADSASSIGSPQVGGPYTVRSGTWGISTNRAYVSATPSLAQVTAPGVVNVDIQCTLGSNQSSSIQAGLMFRWLDANNHWALHARVGNGTGNLYIVVGGTATQMLATNFSVGSSGDVMRAVAVGSRIFVYVNGVIVGQAEDPYFGNGASAVGLKSWGSSSPFFSAISASDAVATDWGASPEGFNSTVEFPADFPTVVPSLYKGRNTAAQDESEIP